MVDDTRAMYVVLQLTFIMALIATGTITTRHITSVTTTTRQLEPECSPSRAQFLNSGVR
jgi:hypothetical protein